MTDRLQALDERVLGALGRLDRRVAPGVARRPEVVLVLIAALFLAGGATRFALLSGAEGEPDPQPITVAPDAPELGGGTGGSSASAVQVGPDRGEDIEAYVAQRHADLANAAEVSPGAPALGVVSFDRYLSPAQAEAAVAAVSPFAVRYRLPVDDPFGEEGVAQLTRGRAAVDGDLAEDLIPALRQEARSAREQAEELDELIGSADDPEFAETFRADRNRLLAAAALVTESGCACVYAVEVQGTLGELADLVAQDDVRLVDVAPAAAAGGAVAFTALLPEERGRAGRP